MQFPLCHGEHGADDADANSTHEFDFGVRAGHVISTRRTSSTEIESIAPRDEERGRQSTSSSPIYRPRDAEAGREEQHQDPIPSCESFGGGETRPARGGKRKGSIAFAVEAVLAAVSGEMERIFCKFSRFRKCPPTRSPGCEASSQAGPEDIRHGLQEGPERTSSCQYVIILKVVNGSHVIKDASVTISKVVVSFLSLLVAP